MFDMFKISSFLNWMMRGVSETEIHFNSVERIIEYSNLESEPYDSKDASGMLFVVVLKLVIIKICCRLNCGIVGLSVNFEYHFH
jgi:hypothetical protein